MGIEFIGRLVVFDDTQANVEANAGSLGEMCLARRTEDDVLGFSLDDGITWFWCEGGSGGGDVSQDGVVTPTHLAVWTDDNLIGDGGAIPEGTGIDGWTALIGSWAYVSADAPVYVISIDADVTGILGPGMRIKLTDSTVKFFIIHVVGSYSGGVTQITIYGGTDYGLSGGAISNVYYSVMKGPFGFPLSPTKWSVTLLDTTQRYQGGVTVNLYYSPGSLSIVLPIGAWEFYAKITMLIQGNNAGQFQLVGGFSTSLSSFTDKELVGYMMGYAAGGYAGIAGSITVKKYLVLASKTTYYPVMQPTQINGTSNCTFQNDKSTMSVIAVSAYL